MSEKQAYPVLSAVRHNGELYTPDDPERNTIGLTEKEAAVLLKLKVIGEPDADDGDRHTPPTPPAMTEEERKEKLTEAIKGLNPERDFTQNGNPKVKAVETATGFDVTADEVSAIWQVIKPAE